MRAGGLREYLTLLRPTTQTVDAAGDFTDDHEVATAVWGSIEPLSAEESYYAHQVQTGATHKVTIRYRSDVNSKWRVRLFDGRLFTLGPPLSTMERKRDLVFTARESF